LPGGTCFFFTAESHIFFGGFFFCLVLRGLVTPLVCLCLACLSPLYFFLRFFEAKKKKLTLPTTLLRKRPDLLRLGGFVGDVSVDSVQNIEDIAEAYGRANLAVAGRHVFFFLAYSGIAHFFWGFFFCLVLRGLVTPLVCLCLACLSPLYFFL